MSLLSAKEICVLFDVLLAVDSLQRFSHKRNTGMRGPLLAFHFSAPVKSELFKVFQAPSPLLLLFCQHVDAGL